MRQIPAIVFMFTVVAACNPSQRVGVAIGTEYQLPIEDECPGFRDMLRWFMLSNMALPLVRQDAFARIIPGLASKWILVRPDQLCFTIDVSKSYTDITPVTPETAIQGLQTAFTAYPDYLRQLVSMVDKIEPQGDTEVCMTFHGDVEALLNQLSLPLAAPHMRKGESCYYAGDLVIRNGALKHRKTAEEIPVISVRSNEDKSRFLQQKGRINIFHEVQMYSPAAETMQALPNMRIIPVRGANRIAFMYMHQPLPERLAQCLRRERSRPSWPFPTATVAETFLPPAFWGGPLSNTAPPSETSNSIGGVEPTKPICHFNIAAAETYNSTESAQFFTDWFSRCGCTIQNTYYHKSEFEQSYRKGTLPFFDVFLTSVGITYPDPRPSLADYFVNFEEPLAWKGGLFPLKNILAPPTVVGQQLRDELLLWERTISSSNQLIPVGHFTPYTIVTAPSQKRISCLPSFTSNTVALPLQCLFE